MRELIRLMLFERETLRLHPAYKDGALVLIRVPRSHRKLDRFISRLGYKPQFLYSFRFGGNFVWVTTTELEAVKELVTRARVDTTQLLQCWEGSDA